MPFSGSPRRSDFNNARALAAFTGLVANHVTLSNVDFSGRKSGSKKLGALSPVSSVYLVCTSDHTTAKSKPVKPKRVAAPRNGDLSPPILYLPLVAFAHTRHAPMPVILDLCP